MEFRPTTRSNRAALASYVAIALATAVLVGDKAAHQPKTADSCPTPHPLEKVSLRSDHNLLSNSGVEVTNEGLCAGVYDRDSQRRLASLATGQSITVLCSDTKPNSFEVALSDNATGFVTYANDLKVVGAELGNEPLIPNC